MSRHWGDNDPALRSARERRLAASLLRRQSSEFVTAGQRLVEQRQATERAAKEAELARQRRLKWEADQRKPVSDAELSRVVEQVEASIREAALDSRMAEDQVAYDVVIGACLSMRPPLAREVKRVMLGIMPDEEDQ